MISVFVGTDAEGDDCIYVKSGSNYIGGEELEQIAAHLEKYLDAHPELIDTSNDGDDLCDACMSSGVVVDHTHDGETVCVECAKDCEQCAEEED